MSTPLPPDDPTGPAPQESAAPRIKPFAAVLHTPDVDLEAVLARLGTMFSPVDHCGADHAFDTTDYYAAEMGAHLLRRIVSFASLATPAWLVGAKQQAALLEQEWSREGRRRINVDVGYLDLGKVVLASGKGRPSKFYLGRGVWADLVLAYLDGGFQPMPWTFPDFRDGRYDADLRAIRERYRAQCRPPAR